MEGKGRALERFDVLSVRLDRLNYSFLGICWINKGFTLFPNFRGVLLLLQFAAYPGLPNKSRGGISQSLQSTVVTVKGRLIS